MAVVEVVSIQGTSPSFDGVFPLPLTTFETLMVTDARPDYPMLVDWEMQFQGCIDRAAFDKALAFAVARNPLFTCLVQREGRQPWHWLPSDQFPQVDWAPLGTPLAGGHGEPIDLTCEIGLKIWVRFSDDRSTVLLHFHHACSDGMGAYAFTEDFLTGYNAAVPGAAKVDARPLEPERLKRRGLIGVTGRSVPRQILDSVVGAVEGIRFFAEAPLAMPSKVEPAAGSGQALFQTHTCGPDVVEGLRLAAIQSGANANDVLIRDLMLTLGRWHGGGGRQPRWRRLRILMPQSLRETADARMPACNAMSFAFITRKTSNGNEPKKMLTSIAAETAKVRRGKLSLYFLGSLAAMQSLNALSWLLRRRICFSTAVLSNLGDPTRRFVSRFPKSRQGLVVGDLTFQSVAAAPPLRPLTRASLCVVYVGGTMTICLKCDPLCYSPSDVRQLLDEYAAQLTDTAKQAATKQAAAKPAPGTQGIVAHAAE